MSNFFAGIEKTEREGANKGQYFSDGDYLVEIQSFTARKSTNPKNKGQVVAVVAATVVEVLRATPSSNAVGSKLAWINILERDIEGDLTQKGERNMGRIKNFAAAALGGVEDEAITAAVVGGLTEAIPSENIGEGEALKGVRLRAEAVTNVGKSSGKAFTNVVWETVAEQTVAEQA